MNYLFRDRWYDVPRYAPYPGCRLVRVAYTIPLARVVPRDQRVIARSWRKVWKFITAEGFVETAKKIRSKQEQERINGDFHVVLAVGTTADEMAGETEAAISRVPVLCFGTRHPRCAEVMLFHEELIAPVTVLPEAELCLRVVEEVAQSSGMDEAGWQLLAGYNFYSDSTPPTQAVDLLHKIASYCRERVSPEPSGKEVLGTAEQSASKPAVIRPVTALINSSRPATQMRRGGQSVQGRGVAVIAAGDYVRTQIVPALRRSGMSLQTVVDLEPYLAEDVRQKLGFAGAMTDWRAAVSQPEIDIVIVASYHDSHAEIAAASLRLGKKVLVEKPPVVTRADLSLLLEAARRPGAWLEVGYNRRYASFTRKAKESLDLASGPTTILCIVKEVEIPDEHWYRWLKEGTRITGNICHWIDLIVYLLGAENKPLEMTVTGPADTHPDEERGLNILFQDGSTATIIATTRGDDTLGVQELIEVRRGRLTIRIDDYRSIHATHAGRTLYHKRGLREKGHARMYNEVIERMKQQQPALYRLEELELTSLLTIQATEMIKDNVRHVTLPLMKL